MLVPVTKSDGTSKSLGPCHVSALTLWNHSDTVEETCLLEYHAMR